MKIMHLTTLAFVSVMLVGCEPPDPEEPAVPDDDQPVMEEDRDFEEETVSLGDVDDSGVTGEIRLVEDMNRTQVMLEVEGAQPNATLSARVAMGSCDRIDEIDRGEQPDEEPGQQPGEQMMDQQQELETIQTNPDGYGVSSTVLEMPMNQLVDGNHVLIVEDEAGQIVSCADLDRGMGW